MAYGPDAHWRDSARTARFFWIDARAAFPLFLFLMHISFWTLGIALVATSFFSALEHYGFTVPVFLRLTRVWLAGKRKISHPWWK